MNHLKQNFVEAFVGALPDWVHDDLARQLERMGKLSGRHAAILAELKQQPSALEKLANSSMGVSADVSGIGEDPTLAMYDGFQSWARSVDQLEGNPVRIISGVPSGFRTVQERIIHGFGSEFLGLEGNSLQRATDEAVALLKLSGSIDGEKRFQGSKPTLTDKLLFAASNFAGVAVGLTGPERNDLFAEGQVRGWYLDPEAIEMEEEI